MATSDATRAVQNPGFGTAKSATSLGLTDNDPVDRNKAAAEAKRRRAAQTLPVADLLLQHFQWRGDSTDRSRWADVSGWWRDATLLQSLGPALADLFSSERPTLIVGPQSRGMLVGALVATHLGVGFVEIRKNSGPSADSDAWRTRTTPPDYRDRHLSLGFPRHLVTSGERVLFVDDWIATGGQASGTRALVTDAGATWLGAAVIVDGLQDARLRRDLSVRALLHQRVLDDLR